MKVQNEIYIYEIDGEKTKVGNEKTLIITNVWNKKCCVEIQIGQSGERIVVLAKDLRNAINNATNNE